MYLEEKRTADSQYASGIRKTSTKGAFAWHLTYPRGEITEWRHSAVSQDFSFELCLQCDSTGLTLSRVLLSGAGAAWLEVYHFPRGTWLTKMAQAQAQTEVL